MFVPLCWGEISPVNVKTLYNDEIGRINKRLCPSLFVISKQSMKDRIRNGSFRCNARLCSGGRGRSFTKAAQTLHMSKTTVTQLIQQLESRLRVRLLHRTTRKLGVTPDGAVYYERVIRLLADMEDAENSLSSAAMTPGDGYGWMYRVRWPVLFWCRRYRLSTPATLISRSTWV